ncbi:PQ-loop repeat family protein / transmembrane family protein [Thalictrum thalictroides]|uniref:PQ-loop repeat family protein / transmembrane family protein n=1 Tax=Thalictrum thalictroides TaxID=46969 RepID=A0A7J6WRH1_THATH|nr:PQ-loop repeat family protein / transmembrane family protein [Thalictrum thalictroides]
MGLLNGSPPVCPTDHHCSQWAQTYIKYCLCTTRDSVSLALGLLSVLSWGVAEVPQIITNYRHKSAEGLSIAFLMTWILGDLFNLFGCMLEPATLPTQYYMAVLYTITTLILTSQSIYYGHIYHHVKDSRQDLLDSGLKLPQSVTEYKEDRISNEENVKFGDRCTRGSSILQGALPSSPIPVTAPVLPRYGSLGRELYYMSARSLSKSHTPTAGSCLAQTIDNGSTLPFSIHGPHAVEEPLLGTLVFPQPEPPSNTKSMLCLISAVTFFFGSFNFHLSTSYRLKRVGENLPQGVVLRVGRKLLQASIILA